MMRSNPLIFLCKVFGNKLVGSLIIGVNNNSPLQMMRYESGRKTHGHGGYDRINMCLRRFFSVIEHYGSLAGLYGKREYLANCTITYGSLTKTRVVRWLIHLENGSTWQAVLRAVR